MREQRGRAFLVLLLSLVNTPMGHFTGQNFPPPIVLTKEKELISSTTNLKQVN